MGRTLALNSRVNVKQATGADLPLTPAQIVTSSYGPVASTAGQTIITLPFAVTVANADNFFLTINGVSFNLGASFDYTFTNIQSNGTSSQITLHTAIASAGLAIRAVYLGVMQPAQAATSIATVQAQINALTPLTAKNELINAALDFWQRVEGASLAVTTGTSAYAADRWYCTNASGVNAAYQRVTGGLDGSTFGAQVTFGASATSSALTLSQTLENANFRLLYNKTVSLGLWIKGKGNTNQVKVQLGYNTSEAKGATATLSTQTFTVNTTGYTFCSIANIAVGTAMGVGGTLVLQVTCSGTTIGTGNVFDSGNGFTMEQAVLNLGTTVATFSRAGRNISDEFAMCQRYYEKSYDQGVALGSANEAGLTSGIAVASNLVETSKLFKVTKRVSGSATATIYSYNGTVNEISQTQSTSNFSAATATRFGTTSILDISVSGATVGTSFWFHWTSDAEI